MPNVAIMDMTGKKVGDFELKESIFGIEPNAVVMHAAVVNYLANQRQGTQLFGRLLPNLLGRFGAKGGGNAKIVF